MTGPLRRLFTILLQLFLIAAPASSWPFAAPLPAGPPDSSIRPSLSTARISGTPPGAVTLPPAPPAKRLDFVEEVNGRRIPDPYRWLEDQDGAETGAWLASQRQYAEDVLSGLPAVPELTRQLEPFYQSDRMTVPFFSEGFYYYTRKQSGAERYSICRRPTLDGPETVVLDPARISADPTVTVEIRSVSPKGKYLAYSVRDGGEDETAIRILDLESNADLPDLVSRGMHWSFSFNHTGDGFYYSSDDKIQGGKILFHRLGTRTTDDALIYQAPRREYWVSIFEIEEGKKQFLNLGIGWQRQEFYIRDQAANGEWIPVIQGIDAQFEPCWVDNKFWVITDFGAPRGRVMEIDLNDPAPGKWKEIIPESQDVLDGLANTGGRLYLQYIHNAAHRIRICEMDGTFVRELELPGPGTAGLPRGGGEKGWLLFTFQSFTQPATVYLYNPRTAEKKIWYQDPAPVDTKEFAVHQEWCESRDGTRLPVWIVHRPDIKLDGTNPVILNGYGGFNSAILPGYSALSTLWISRGGIWALANIRGGSEFGRAWHKGGMLQSKQNVFDDFIAAAEHLIRRQYTAPSRLAIRGGSNGGLLMGAALTQRPDLFGAVSASVPEFDLAGFPRYRHINPPALLEYGDASKPEDFEFIIRWSPYQNIRPATAYPAVLVLTGSMDSRVDPIEACKTVAKLQWATNSGKPVVFNHYPRMGHSGGRPVSRQWQDAARELAFLEWQLGLQPVPSSK